MLERIWKALDGKKKFLGLVLATVLCWFGKISGGEWVTVFGLFAAADVSGKAMAAGKVGGASG